MVAGSTEYDVVVVGAGNAALTAALAAHNEGAKVVVADVIEKAGEETVAEIK